MRITNLVVDVETGGFSIEHNPLLEIGWALCDDDWNVLDADSVGVLPQRGTVIHPKAVEINKYSEDVWATYGLPIDQAVQTFLTAMAAFQGDVCYGHNVGMENRWIGAHVPTFHSRIREWRCSMEWLRSYHAYHGIKDSASLESACALIGHTNEDEHSAMGDCIATAALLRFLSKNKSAPA